MKYLKKKPGLLRKFARDQRGAHVVVTGLMLFPMLALGMLAVDYGNAERVKTEMDTATEAVALHTAKRIALDPNLDPVVLADESKAMLRDMTPELNVQFEDFDVDMQTGRVKIVAYADVGTFFAGAFNSLADKRESDAQAPTELRVYAKNEARFGRRNIEVAIGIDNSTSMNSKAVSTDTDTKMDSAKDAVRELITSASGAVDSLSNAQLKFSLVPWTTVVRVDPSDIGGENAWWIDWDGESSNHFRYLPPFDAGGDMFYDMPKRSNDWRNAYAVDDEFPFYDPNKLADAINNAGGDSSDPQTIINAGGRIVTRRDVFAATGTQWRGCFEHRAGEFRTTFDEPKASIGDSLYVPYMEPDELDSDFTSVSYAAYRNDYVADTAGASDYARTQYWYQDSRGRWRSYWVTDPHDAMQFDWNDNSPRDGYNDNPQGVDAAQVKYVDVVRARLMNTPKYSGNNVQRRHVGEMHPWGYPYGPNGKCYDQPTLLPLSDNTQKIDDAIDSMTPNGNTDASIGMAWTMNTLTPWAPIEGAGEFGDTQKVLVFVSDGDNFTTLPNDYIVSYSSLGYFLDDPLGLGSSYNEEQAHEFALDALDGTTLALCESIKKKGVRIYFVYFGQPSDRALKLRDGCASSPDTAISASSGEELKKAFKKIGDDIGKLRLVHYNSDD